MPYRQIRAPVHSGQFGASAILGCIDGKAGNPVRPVRSFLPFAVMPRERLGSVAPGYRRQHMFERASRRDCVGPHGAASRAGLCHVRQRRERACLSADGRTEMRGFVGACLWLCPLALVLYMSDVDIRNLLAEIPGLLRHLVTVFFS